MLPFAINCLFYVLMCVPVGDTGRVDVWKMPEFLLRRRRRQSDAPSGVVFKLVGGACLSPTTAAKVRMWTRVAFFLSATGFGGSWPRLAAALGYFWLAGVCAEFGSAKKQIVPCFTMFYMCLSSVEPLWSVDGALARRLGGGYPFQPPTEGVRLTEMGPMLAYYHLSWTLIGSVCGKLRRNPRWGFTLADILHRRKEEARVPSLKRWMVEHPYITAAMGHAALILEASVVVGIGWSALRPWILISMTLFHVGIAAVMPPVFYNQAICYLVMVDWQAFFFASRQLPLVTFADLPGTTQYFFCSLLMGLTPLLATSTVICPFEFWPLSECAFYSAGVEVVEKALSTPSRTALEAMLMNRNNKDRHT